MNDPQRRSFVMYFNFSNQFHMLSMPQRGALITAIFEYAQTGTLSIGLKGTTAMAFSFIKDVLDRDREQYLAVCERNAENGKKGGRPRAENPEKPKKPDNDTDNENKNKNDNDNKNDIDTGKDNDTKAVPQGSATPQRSATAPPLTQEEIFDLIDEGISVSYIETRQQRAAECSAKSGRKASDLLRAWWEEDGMPRKNTYPREVSVSPRKPETKHFSNEKGASDVEEWLELICKKQMEEMEREKRH